jgi:hypothetical protein
VLRQKALDKRVVDKIKEQNIYIYIYIYIYIRYQDGLNIHLPQEKKQLKGMLRNKIALGSTMHGLLQQLGLW